MNERLSASDGESVIRDCPTCGGEREHAVTVRESVDIYRCLYCDRSRRESR